jgi:arylsulfatase
MVNTFHLNEAFGRMVARHEVWKKQYPDAGRARGIAYDGLSNARPETKALGNPPAEFEDLPFDLEAVRDYELPWEFQADPDIGQ